MGGGKQQTLQYVDQLEGNTCLDLPASPGGGTSVAKSISHYGAYMHASGTSVGAGVHATALDVKVGAVGAQAMGVKAGAKASVDKGVHAGYDAEVKAVGANVGPVGASVGLDAGSQATAGTDGVALKLLGFGGGMTATDGAFVSTPFGKLNVKWW